MFKLLKSQSGVSLVEIVVVIAAVGFLIILISSLPNSINLVTKSKYLSVAREIADKQIEDERALQYANLANTTSVGLDITDPRMKLLPQGVGKYIIADCDPSICTKSESIKTVTVTISWSENSKTQAVNVTTLIGDGGLSK